MKIRNTVKGIGLIVILISCTHCTVLQWRHSDKDLQTIYKAKQIETAIHYFKVDSLDVKIRIQSVNNPTSAINLVFLHGSPSSLSAWQAYLTDATLRQQTSMLAIDRPGYGYSNFGKSMPAIVDQAKLMNAILEDQQLKNVIIIGTSYGGPIAARVALYNPNVKAVIMMSPAIDPKLEKNVWGSGFTQCFLTRWLVPTGYRVAGDEKTVHASELEQLKTDWNLVQQPIVHIHGDADDLVPYENIHFSQSQFKNCTVVTIPYKGHEIAWKYPELMIPHILKSVAQVAKR